MHAVLEVHYIRIVLVEVGHFFGGSAIAHDFIILFYWHTDQTIPGLCNAYWYMESPWCSQSFIDVLYGMIKANMVVKPHLDYFHTPTHEQRLVPVCILSSQPRVYFIVVGKSVAVFGAVGHVILQNPGSARAL